MILVSQLDLNGNPVSLPVEEFGKPAGLPSSGRLALMAAKGADLRLLLIVLIAMAVSYTHLTLPTIYSV